MKQAFALAALMTMGAGLNASVFGPQYTNSYTFTLSPNFNDVSNIIIFESGSGYGDTTWAFSVSDCGGLGCTSTITNPFTSPTPITSAFLLGITQNLPNDAPGQEHLVIFGNQAFAAAANGVDWGALFPNTNEDQLIADIQLATSGQSFATIQPGFDGINTFLNGDGANYGNTGNSVWFNVGAPIKVVAFSTGQIIGTGTASSTVVPEPGGLALAIAGGLILGVALRRRGR